MIAKTFTPKKDPVGLLFAGMCGGVIVPWCPGAAWCAVPPGGCGGRQPAALGLTPPARLIVGRSDLPPRQGADRDIPGISPSLPPVSNHRVVLPPMIRGVIPHDNEVDRFPACSGEYLRGGRAGDARTGPAGAVRPGRGRVAGRGRSPAGTTPATGCPQAPHGVRGISQRGQMRAAVSGPPPSP